MLSPLRAGSLSHHNTQRRSPPDHLHAVRSGALPGRDRAQAADRPFEHLVVVRPTKFRDPETADTSSGAGAGRPTDPAALSSTAHLPDRERNDLIVADILAAVRAGRSPWS